MPHEALPQTMTVENLSAWITENAAENIQHTEETPHTPEYIAELEHKSSVASRQIDILKDVEKSFKTFLKKGTPTDPNTIGDEEVKHLPQEVTIPPTKGLEILEANRKWADDLILKGVTEDITELYLIPWPEKKKMVAVDIEGNEWSDYSRKMYQDEEVQFGQLFAEEKEEIKPSKGKGKRNKESFT